MNRREGLLAYFLVAAGSDWSLDVAGRRHPQGRLDAAPLR